jgi:hypothetical protein
MKSEAKRSRPSGNDGNSPANGEATRTTNDMT